MKTSDFIDKKVNFKYWYHPLGRKEKLKMISEILSQPNKYKPFFADSMKGFHADQISRNKKTLPIVSRESCIDIAGSINVRNCFSQSANVTSEELLCIAGIVAKRQPKRLLEIGTLDGNTTLQMALNAPEDAVVHTLDLPPHWALPYNLVERRYVNTPMEKKVRQHLGDSMEFDFAQFAQEGEMDVVFIDANHDYEFVKNDTLKALKILGERGCMLWHDYHPLFSGVFSWLNELSKELPIKQIEGTTLAYYEKG